MGCNSFAPPLIRLATNEKLSLRGIAHGSVKWAVFACSIAGRVVVDRLQWLSHEAEGDLELIRGG